MNNNFAFAGFIALVVLARLTELRVAKKNESWLRKQGAIEYGRNHYPYIVALHTLFIFSMISEYFSRGNSSVHYIYLALFLMLILLKIWTISSLGKYWNTRILRVPGSVFIKRGPYKYFRHPNYFIVICEIAIIPMVFGLYFTSVLFSLLNCIMLIIRIREEEKVWQS